MSGHTPGPWYFRKLEAGGCHICSDQVMDPSGPTVIGAAYIDGGCIGDEMEANARLIAAAPDLLEALEWLAYEAGQYADGAEDSHYLAREMANFETKARKAIAKATEKD